MLGLCFLLPLARIADGPCDDGKIMRPLTVSIGGVPHIADAGVPDLMHVAWRRLYEAKRPGCNPAILGQNMPARRLSGAAWRGQLKKAFQDCPKPARSLVIVAKNSGSVNRSRAPHPAESTSFSAADRKVDGHA